jgi:hypothetical protein
MHTDEQTDGSIRVDPCSSVVDLPGAGQIRNADGSTSDQQMQASDVQNRARDMVKSPA